MIDAFAQGKSPACFICFGIGNLWNFAIFKSLRKFGTCLVDNDNFFLLKASFKFFVFNFICNNCDFFYIGQTKELKQRTQKHKSDVIHPNNSNCKKWSEHLTTYS